MGEKRKPVEIWALFGAGYDVVSHRRIYHISGPLTCFGSLLIVSLHGTEWDELIWRKFRLSGWRRESKHTHGIYMLLLTARK
jgi:hypothetical protein